MAQSTNKATTPSKTLPADGMSRWNARILVDGMLTAARTGGYTQCDILHTLLARNQMTPRVMAMVQAACNAAGDAAMRELLARVGL